jgi:hypothetical protein
MTDDDRRTDASTDQPDTAAEVDPDVAQLLGLRPPDADPVPTADEVDTMGEMTDTRIYQGDLEARPPDSDQPDDSQAENLESLIATEFREGETDDPNDAAEEGLAWVPPTDPPIRTAEDGSPEVAAGFSTSAGDEPFDADHHSAPISPHDEVETRVLEALRADAATTGLVDELELDAEGGRIIVAGRVEDMDDEDAVVAVADEVTGVTEVVSRMEVDSI